MSAVKEHLPKTWLAFNSLAICFLAGCAIQAEIASSIGSFNNPVYRQTSVANLELRINGKDIYVRAPVECRSFVLSKTRITRNSGERFILAVTSNQLELIEFSYSCSEADASITLHPKVLVYLYRAQRSPSPVITRDVAVPLQHPKAKLAEVVLVDARLDPSDRTTNVTPVDSIDNELKRFLSDTGSMQFASVQATYLAVPGSHVAPEDAQELLKYNQSTVIPREYQTRVAKRLPNYSLILDTDNPQFDRELEEIHFEYLPIESVFVPRGRSGGRLTYYPVYSSHCEKQYQHCLKTAAPARIGGHDFPYDLRMVYDPQTRGIYHFGIRWL